MYLRRATAGAQFLGWVEGLHPECCISHTSFAQPLPYGNSFSEFQGTELALLPSESISSFGSLHIMSHAFRCPSRWKPFGYPSRAGLLTVNAMTLSEVIRRSRSCCSPEYPRRITPDRVIAFLAINQPPTLRPLPIPHSRNSCRRSAPDTALRVVRTDHGTKITDRTYVRATHTAFHLLMRSG